MQTKCIMVVWLSLCKYAYVITALRAAMQLVSLVTQVKCHYIRHI